MTPAHSLYRPAKYSVAGIGVSEITFDEAVSWLLDAPARGDRLRVHFTTAHTIVEASRNPSLGDALRSAELIAADGMPLVVLGRLRGRKVSRVCGPDLMPALVDQGRRVNARHFLYGGTETVTRQLAKALEERFPGARIVGAYSPPFRVATPDEEIADVERINSARPDYVWVGLGCPKQDLWAAKHRGQLHAAAVLTVGAAFDIHAGHLRRAPGWMQRSGLEWLFRLAMEPRRLAYRYTTVNALFLWLILRETIGTRLPGR